MLGGGGITGIAWEVGVLTGLADAGVDLSGTDLVVGTSAGSVVGAQVTCGADLAAMYERQLEPPDTGRPAREARAALARYGWARLRSIAQPNWARVARLRRKAFSPVAGCI